jgi:hypothetical protein
MLFNRRKHGYYNKKIIQTVAGKKAVLRQISYLRRDIKEEQTWEDYVMINFTVIVIERQIVTLSLIHPRCAKLLGINETVLDKNSFIQ